MRRKCIRLNPAEHKTLAGLYVQENIATDRYMHRRRELQALTRTFNALTGRDDTAEEILHYMQSKRRHAGKWPTLGDGYQRLPVVMGNLIDAKHGEVLVGIYVRLLHGPESFMHDRALGHKLEQAFVDATHVRVSAYVLATALLELRKAGTLPRLPGQPRRQKPFSDFDEAEDNTDS